MIALRLSALALAAAAVGCGTSAGSGGGASAGGARTEGGTVAGDDAGASRVDAASPLCLGARCGGECVMLDSDVKNCGACGSDCSGGQCANGLCTLASGQARPAAIAVDGANAYFGSAAGGSTAAVMKVALRGGAPTAVAIEQAFAIGTDGRDVFWSTSGTIRRAAPAVTGALTLATTGGGTWAIALDSANVYFSESYGGGSVKKVSLDGGAVGVLGPQQSLPLGVAVDDASVYWANSLGGTVTVMKVGLAGGNPVTVAQTQGEVPASPTPIVVDATSVYFITGPTTTGSGDVLRAPKAGGQATTFQPAHAVALAVDASNVYWTDAAGSVMKASVAGGSPTTIAAFQQGPLGVAVDSTAVYWTTVTHGTVMKSPK